MIFFFLRFNALLSRYVDVAIRFPCFLIPIFPIFPELVESFVRFHGKVALRRFRWTPSTRINKNPMRACIEMQGGRFQRLERSHVIRYGTTEHKELAVSRKQNEWEHVLYPYEPFPSFSDVDSLKYRPLITNHPVYDRTNERIERMAKW